LLFFVFFVFFVVQSFDLALQSARFRRPSSIFAAQVAWIDLRREHARPSPAGEGDLQGEGRGSNA
jgi:hypothetical protein